MLITYLNSYWYAWIIGITSSWASLRFSNLPFLKRASVIGLIIQRGQIFTMFYNQRTFMIWSKFLWINVIILLIILILIILLILNLLLYLRLLLLSDIGTLIIFLNLNIDIILRRGSFLFCLYHHMSLRT
jgi:hypothetical protein